MEVRLTGNSISQLTDRVKSNFKNLGMEIPEDLAIIIEHQICLRQPAPMEVCWNDGIGDELANEWITPILTSIARKAAKLGAEKIARIITLVAGCSPCKGAKTYVAGESNLGRAGKLNKLSR